MKRIVFIFLSIFCCLNLAEKGYATREEEEGRSFLSHAVRGGKKALVIPIQTIEWSLRYPVSAMTILLNGLLITHTIAAIIPDEENSLRGWGVFCPEFRILDSPANSLLNQ